MLKSLGNIVLSAVERSKPIFANGKSALTRNEKFSLSNPYILEVLPNEALSKLSIFEGKKLSTVTRIMDDANFNQITQRYSSFTKNLKSGFTNEELAELLKKANLRGKHPTNSNLDAMVYLTDLDGNIAQHFDAHGISKISISEQLVQLNQLLTKGIDKERAFFTAPLDVPNSVRAGAGAALGTSGGCAVRDGSFIIVADKGKRLIDNGIKHVIVNDTYYGIFDDLVAKFPHIKFVKAENAAEYFNKM